MFEIDVDVSDAIRIGRIMGVAEQRIPEAMAGLLNDAAFKARRVLVESTWPSHVTVRNRAFLSAALRVGTATPASLQIVIFDTLGRANLYAHAYGAIVAPKRASRFAIPNLQEVRRTARGTRPTPSELIKNTPPNRLWLTKEDLFVSEGGRLHLKYSFKSQVTLPKRVPFAEDFEYTVRHAIRTGYVENLLAAMQPRH